MRKLFVSLVGLLALVATAIPSGAYPRPGRTEMASVDILGGRAAIGEVDGFEMASTVSGTGRFVAMYTDATDLVKGDLNFSEDTFVRDMKTGITQLVSVTSSGLPAAGAPVVEGSFNPMPAISGSGRYVAFVSDDTNLAFGDTNDSADVFIHDVRDGTTERISVSSKGEQADGVSDVPSISGNGRFVVFRSWASNLIPDDTNEVSDVFIRDLRNETTTRLSVSSTGQQADAESSFPSIDSTGRYVAFLSNGANLVDDDTNGWGDVFVRDLVSGKTERVSLANGGREVREAAYSDQWGPKISAGGRYVTFSSASAELIPNKGTPINVADVYVYDRNRYRIERVSVSSAGEVAPGVPNTNSNSQSISGDGRFIAFESGASNFFPNDSENLLFPGAGDYDVFRHDVQTGATELVSIDIEGRDCEMPPLTTEQFQLPESGTGKAGESFAPKISTDGRNVVFESFCVDLIPDDNPLTGNGAQVYRRYMGLSLGTEIAEDAPPPLPDEGEICIPFIACIPPLKAVTSEDSPQDVGRQLTHEGADVHGLSLASRPAYGDLFVATEIEYMPFVIPGVSPVFYGLRFEVNGRSYDVRSTSLLGGTFELFDCTAASGCTKVRDLRGGYGTTGMRVVFSLPLDAIGLENGGELSNVEAYSALGSSLTGATKILDTVRLR